MRLQSTRQPLRQHSSNMQGVQGPLLRAQARRGVPRPRLFLSARCMASGNGSDNKSWSEIAGEAAQVAKSAFDKAARGVSDTVGKLLPRDKETRPEGRDNFEDVDEPFWPSQRNRQKRRGNEIFRPEDGPFGGGLLGRAAGSVLGGMFGQLSEALAETGREAAGAKQQALSMIQGNDQVRAALGEDIQITPGMDSQSSSTSVINGRRSKQTSLTFLVAGSSGRTATAQASISSKGDGAEEVEVAVQLPDGRVVRISDNGKGGRGGSGATIDVDWREVR